MTEDLCIKNARLVEVPPTHTKVWIVMCIRDIPCEPTEAYDVEEVFSTEEKAKAYVDTQKDPSRYLVEPYGLDENDKVHVS